MGSANVCCEANLDSPRKDSVKGLNVKKPEAD